MDKFYDSEYLAKNLESKREARQRRDREINDMQRVLKLPEGRRFVWRILSQCGIFHASFTQNSMQSSFNEGRRDIGLGLLGDLNEADVFAYAKMQQEYVSELKSKKQVKESKEEQNG